MKLGKHIIIDVSSIEEIELIANLDYMKILMIDIVEKLKLKVIGFNSFQFKPYGCSIIYLLSESHLSVHTYPEYNAFSFDLYSCDLDTNFDLIEDIIINFFNGKCIIMKKIIDR